MPEAMTVGSLFSGIPIGGIDLGLERAGMRVVWQCESNPYARAVLRKHWPSVTCYEDISRLRGSAVAPVDLLAGGFPCQDISAAGLGAGLGGERSGLWFHFARIIGETRPSYAIIESTPPFRRWVPVVRRHLRSAGYASVCLQLSAADAGAPHLRKRVFVLAHANSEPGRLQSGRGRRKDGAGAAVLGHDGAAEHLADTEGNGWEPWWARYAAQIQGGRESDRGRVGKNGVGHSDRSRKLQPKRFIPDEWGRPSDAGWWDAEPDVGRVADGVPSRVDRLRCLGNAVVPQVAEYIGRCILKMSAANAAQPPEEASKELK